MEKKTLGMMISSARKDLDMTQVNLAEKMNVTDKAVSKWERDLSCPDISSLPKLASILGTTVDELIQAKKNETAEIRTGKIKAIIPLILRAVAVAMGVAVTVLSILGDLDTNAGVTMLALGLTCLGLSVLEEKSK